MDVKNRTLLKSFYLVGYPEDMQLCLLFFVSLLIMYIFTVFGNVFVIITVIFSPKLHLPMYYFLCNLSFLDLCFSSCSLPKAMVEIFSLKRTISVISCIVQMNTGLFLGGTESFLLAVMAYDRYVAVCLPLHYTIIMNWKTCRILTMMMWLVSIFILTVLPNMRPMLFCKENRLDHFVCEMLAVLQLVCGNVFFLKVTLLIVSLITLIVPLVFIVVSYVLIISSIIKIQSTEGRSKAFSTCASHLTIVSMFYGTSMSMYFGQMRGFSSNIKYFSLIYGMITPALNPLIYTLRNNDVKKSFRLIVTKLSSSVNL